MYQLPKYSLLFFALLLHSFHLPAQDLEVVASSGFASGNEAFTIGESFIAYQSQASAMLTEGFHQPAIGPTTAITGEIQDGGEFTLGPNPAADFTVLRCADPITHDQALTLYDLHGKLLWQHVMMAGESAVQIPLQFVTQSMYFLRVEGDRSRTFRIEKIGY